MKIFGAQPGWSGNSVGGELNQDPVQRRSQINEAGIKYSLKALEASVVKPDAPRQLFVSPYQGLLDKLTSASPAINKPEQKPVINEAKVITHNARPLAAAELAQPINYVSDDIKSAQLAVDAALDSEQKIGDVVDQQLNYEDPSNGAYGA